MSILLSHEPLCRIRGTHHMTMDEVHLRHHDIPHDRDIVLYCSYPNEMSSARVALHLHRKGISRVSPLLGGIDLWRDRNSENLEIASAAGDQPANRTRLFYGH
jgi:rhodanese-related sulfurtransferase